jgi:tRNA(Ile)-lysidine synthase
MTSSLSSEPAPQGASSPVSPESAALALLQTLKTPCRLLVGYSGGGDSTGLLVALATCLKANPDIDISLIAATVDHDLRPESHEEARSAGGLCRQLGIPHHVLRWQGDKPATGIQAAAREARYRLLDALARQENADLILTAHTLDDQIETIEMRKLRSGQATGGISRAVLFDRHIWIFRPFLDVRRDAIRNYLRALGFSWVDDPSNDNEKFERVRVRKALGGVPAPEDFSDRASERAMSGENVARFLIASVAIHGARLAVFDLGGYRVDNPAHLRAVLYLAAFMGGRTHLAGRDTTGRLSRFLSEGSARRMTAERVVFERRNGLLYITRERRGLPEATIAPGACAMWDNRFRIHNKGKVAARVSARGTNQAFVPLLASDIGDDVPKAVRQRLDETEPVLLAGRAEALAVEPIIANFDRFLPLDLLQIANALAFLGG